ncbi:hypothetical protein [Clostridium estertheticum]|nr:hypothetical protein [Clostridium estertheticum]
MEDKINSCKYCVLRRYDRGHREWVCSKGIVRVEGESCGERKEQ